MSNLSIRKTGVDSADIEVSVCKLGNFITAGSTEKVTVGIKDSDDIRSLSARLSQLKTEKFSGLVNIRFSDTQHFSMDQSVWHDLADALFAFSLCTDLANLAV